MKKLSFLILVVLNSIMLQAQTYRDFVRKGDSCYNNKEYKASVDYYEKAFKIEHKSSSDLYNAACSAALLNENKKAFRWLDLAIDNGYENIAHIKIDNDLTSLHTNKEWVKTLDKLQKSVDVLSANYDKPLQKELLAIYAEDQSIRGDFMKIYKADKTDKKAIDSIGKIMVLKDSINLIKVMKILDERGWVGKDVVGTQANQTLFLVIQHADLKYQQKYLPMMREAVKKGNAKASSLALLEDRVALREGRKQIYGSQSSRNKTTNKGHISPMIDPDNVDKRRAEVGLGPMAEYAPKLGIVWDLETYKKELPEIEKLENIK
jgi:tetratricopeptide (TPR) repeat protein